MQSEPEVQELSFRFGQLEISVRVSVRAVPEPASPSVSSFIHIEEESNPSLPESGVSTDFEDRLIAADTPEAFSGFFPQCLEYLVGRLRGTDRLWNSRARLVRAFRAGILSGRRAEGLICAGSSPSLPYRNSVYIILVSADYPQGCWTHDYSKFSRACGGSGSRSFGRNTVCQSLPSLTEAEAFLIGAGQRQWPQKLD